MRTKATLVNNEHIWQEKRRYKINGIVRFNSANWQNITGKNSIPGVGSDWIVTSNPFIPYQSGGWIYYGTDNNVVYIDPTGMIGAYMDDGGGIGAYIDGREGIIVSQGQTTVKFGQNLDENGFVGFQIIEGVSGGPKNQFYSLGNRPAGYYSLGLAEKKFKGNITQNGTSSLQTISSGNLITGVTYEVLSIDPGVTNFRICGAPNESIGTKFICNSNVTPIWGDGGQLQYDEGVPTVEANFFNELGYIWLTYETQGVFLLKSDGLFTAGTTVLLNNYVESAPFDFFLNAKKIDVNTIRLSAHQISLAINVNGKFDLSTLEVIIP